MKNLRFEVIRYAKLLNSRKLSALRSGNISTRYKDGFLITPSGKKYFNFYIYSTWNGCCFEF